MPDGWRIMALDTGTSELEQSMLTYTVGFGQRRPHPARDVAGPGSHDRGHRHQRADAWPVQRVHRRGLLALRDQEPANALRDAGVDPRDVEFVVLTHLHWDHAGNCDLFPDARVLVQQDELRYAGSPGPVLPQVIPGARIGLAGTALPAAQPRDGRRRDRAGTRAAAGSRARPHAGLPGGHRGYRPGLVLHRGRCHQHLRQHRAGHPAGLPCERGRLGRFDGPAARPRRTISCPRTTTRCSRTAASPRSARRTRRDPGSCPRRSCPGIRERMTGPRS